MYYARDSAKTQKGGVLKPLFSFRYQKYLNQLLEVTDLLWTVRHYLEKCVMLGLYIGLLVLL